MNPQNSTVAAGLPVNEPATDFQYGEMAPMISPLVPNLSGFPVLTQNKAVIELHPARDLKRRKLYVWLWADSSSMGNWFVRGHIDLLSGSSKLSVLPVAIGPALNSTYNGVFLTAGIAGSVPMCGMTGGVITEDTILLTVGTVLTLENNASPLTTQTQPSQVVLQPFNIYGQLDGVVLNIDDFSPPVGSPAGNNWSAGILGLRAFMAVVSNED